jgi:predicted nucleotidyltransferase
VSTATSSQPDKLLNVLTSDYKEEVLKELLDNPGYTYTVNEIAKEVSGSYNSVKNFLRELERFDIVSFQKKGGTYLIQYSQDSRYHKVIKNLFMAENQPLKEAAEKYAENLIKKEFSKEISSIILFGSVARGTADVNSDIDILILVGDQEDVETIKSKARNHSERKMKISNELVPVVETVEEYKENLENEERFEKNVSKDGIVLEGEELDSKN